MWASARGTAAFSPTPLDKIQLNFTTSTTFALDEWSCLERERVGEGGKGKDVADGTCQGNVPLFWSSWAFSFAPLLPIIVSLLFFKTVLQFSWCRNCAPIGSSDIASASDWSADPKLCSSFKQCLKAVHCPLYQQQQQQQHLFPLSLLIQLAIKWCTELPFAMLSALPPLSLPLSHLGAATVLHTVLHRQERSRKSSVQSSLVCSSSLSHLSALLNSLVCPLYSSTSSTAAAYHDYHLYDDV